MAEGVHVARAHEAVARLQRRAEAVALARRAVLGDLDRAALGHPGGRRRHHRKRLGVGLERDASGTRRRGEDPRPSRRLLSDLA